MVLAFAHWVAFAVKYCWVPYKPVGSRLASVTFLYWFAAEATVGAVDEGVGAGAGAAGFVALGEGLALRLLWKTPIVTTYSRCPRLWAKCLLKRKRLVSILPMNKAKK